MARVSRTFYAEAADALIGFLPADFRDAHVAVTGRNVKVWYEEPREHYEIQSIRQGRRIVLEIGFHAEHPSEDANAAALERLKRRPATWRRTLSAARAGAFLGTSRPWRRLSETWDDGAPDEPGAAVEAAERLAAYIKALEPLRRKR
jgi:hypothetical protein